MNIDAVHPGQRVIYRRLIDGKQHDAVVIGKTGERVIIRVRGQESVVRVLPRRLEPHPGFIVSSDNMLEIGAEIRNPAKWAAMQIVKAGRPDMICGEAMDMIEEVVNRAIAADRTFRREQWDQHGDRITTAT